MRKLIYPLIVFLVIIIAFSILTNTEAFFQNITSTLNLWLTKVYPSVFTFYTISSILLNTNLFNKFIYYTKIFFKKLRFKDQISLNLFLLSIFIGNPSSSGLIIESIDKNAITINDGNNLLKVSSFSNPLFILAFLFPYSIKYAVIIIFVHIASNIIIAYLMNRNNNHTEIENISLRFSLREIINSINNVIHILLIVSTMMVFSNIIIFSLETTLNFLKINNLFTLLLLSQLEISRGLSTILSLNIESLFIYLLVCFTISFNGFSIHLQVINIISKYSLSYSKFLIFRIIQCILASSLFLIFALIEKSLI
ncbi:MAG TPA: hypothetical protein GX740_06285 [Acholeplasmataceae bacterium]|nr:hypothetical protein [Acholeplasmataceae bacterium]